MLHIQFHILGDVLTEDALYSLEEALTEEYVRTITISLVQHFLPIALACMLSASLFAWAYLKNKKVADDPHAVAHEALRKQRWQLANFSLIGLVGSSVPAIALLAAGFADTRIWSVIALSYLPLIWAIWRYVKIIRLSKRKRAHR